ncbi:ABC transporter ATP-binding protein [Halalkalicoccus tibetensis]|uniref:ABC-type D-xylose/L-arabinose transporter n=1 Tax=Halalkalicoccus tibetensis TaxID=175632 RepID=A0ABD5V7C3_9EURY
MGEIALEELTKVYSSSDKKVVAVDGINLSIKNGEFLVLVGPSGCGKSTTLRCIAGLETVTEGEIKLDGDPITNKKPKERHLAMVFQNYALYPQMTVQENMSFGLKMTTELSDEEIETKVKNVAKMMGIESHLNATPNALSGGQQQRVALGRAIVRDPEAFLMDEPLSNLDAKLRTTMRTELQDLQQDLGVTTVYVTHDQTEAMTMADRIAVMKNGTLQQVAPPLECYNQPKNKFVAGFIGSPSMNFLSVRNQNGHLEHNAFSYSLSEATRRQLENAPDDLTLGIRPEDIVSPNNEKNDIESTVSVVEPMGDQSYLYLEVGDDQLTAKVSSDNDIKSGDKIPITFPEDRIHLFDEQTGDAIKNRSEINKEGNVLENDSSSVLS